jgi:hypothetical protein
MKKSTKKNTTKLSNKRIEPVTIPTSTRKYRSLCEKIHSKYKKFYISYDDDNKPTIDIAELLCILVNHLKPNVNRQYQRNVKYTSRIIVNGIIDVIRNCMYWTRYKGNVPGKYLNQFHNLYAKLGVYDCLYLILLTEYFKKDKFGKLKYQSIDTTFCINLYGSEMKGRNVKYKSKNGIKISVKSDVQGVPFSLGIASGNLHDSVIAKECHIDKSIINPETKRVQRTKYHQELYADAIYDEEEFANLIIQQGCTPIIDPNFRNTKDKVKIRKLKIRKRRYIKKAKKRYVVEAFNSWIHKFPKITRVVEKSIASFRGILLLGCSLVIKNKIT